MKTAVRRYLAADARKKLPALVAWSAGPTHLLWAWTLREFGPCACPGYSLEVSRLDVQSISTNRARVDVSAVIGDQTAIGGPMMVDRIGGRWRVADYLRDGLPMSRIVLPGNFGSQSLGGLTVRVIGVYLPDGTGDAWVRVTNMTGHPVSAQAFEVAGVHPVSSPRGISPNLRQLPAGRSVVSDLGWLPKRPLHGGSRFSLRPVFIDEVTGAHYAFDIPVRLPSAAV